LPPLQGSLDAAAEAEATILSDCDNFWLPGILALLLWPPAIFLPPMPTGAGPVH
jgi:hypothetical protein